jgi:hypothetical protein
MSQERIRFPIQPKDRRRSAASSKDTHVPGRDHPEGKRANPDKPTVPPHRRRERGKHTEDERGT